MFFRRQTLYLFILIILFITMLIFPVAVAMDTTTGEEIIISVHRFFVTQVLSILLLCLALVTLCLYKKKRIQGRITIFIMIVSGALQIVFPVLLQLYTTEKMVMRYELTFVIPLIAALFAYLTFRSITRDEIIEKIIEFRKFDNPHTKPRK